MTNDASHPSSNSQTNGTSSLPHPSSSSQLPPNVSPKSSPHMMMNGDKPHPKESPASNVVVVVARGSTTTATTSPTTINNDTVKQRSNQSKTTANSISSSNNHSVDLSGGSPTDNDAAYCTEIARRSVARAALHLGMEGMEGEALDVLGSVLQGYMEMVGTTISSNVESSGRSSAHSNAYDALNAILDCTAPAATQLGSAPSIFSTATQDPLRDHSRLKEAQERGWEGLASFLFGPDWFSIPLEGEEDATDAAARKEADSIVLPGNNTDGKILQSNGKASASAVKKPGGKTILPSRPNSVGNPTMASPKTSGKGKQLAHLQQGNEKTVSFSLDRQLSGVGGDVQNPAVPDDDAGSSNNAMSGRWHAPYPNSIPSFPLVASTEDIANPHRLPGSKISLSMHDFATEMEACREVPSAKRPRRGSASEHAIKASSAATKAIKLKEEAAEKAMRAALRIPDDVYSTAGTVWGSIQDTNGSSNNKKESGDADGDKKPRASDSKKSAGGDDGKAATSASKVKFDSSSKQPPLPKISDPAASASAQMPSYVPNFLPPFPTDEYSDMAHDRLATSMSASAVMGDVMSRMHEKRKASDITPAGGDKAAISERDAVRRSVIDLGRSAGPTYWGSKWLEDDSSEAGGKGATTNSNNNSNTGKYLADVTVAPGEGGTSSSSTAKKSGPDASQVNPLGKASGMRLSKILEGSMNVS